MEIFREKIFKLDYRYQFISLKDVAIGFLFLDVQRLRIRCNRQIQHG